MSGQAEDMRRNGKAEEELRGSDLTGVVLEGLGGKAEWGKMQRLKERGKLLGEVEISAGDCEFWANVGYTV